jgi:hypothetical protein
MTKKEKIERCFSENTSENYLKKILNCNDDDMCWCDSGKKYKYCHKTFRGKDIIPGRINYFFTQIKKKKCVYIQI